MNSRRYSRSVDYETSTLCSDRASINCKQPVRRKTYAGNISMSMNNCGENNNLKYFDGIALIKDSNSTSINGFPAQEMIPTNREPNREAAEDNANDYIDVYLRKITKTR